jgi:hypothetical protein
LNTVGEAAFEFRLLSGDRRAGLGSSNDTIPDCFGNSQSILDAQ